MTYEAGRDRLSTENPYRIMGGEMSFSGMEPLIDPERPGLTATTLDRLVRMAAEEGEQLGRRRTIEEARAENSEAWDRGADAAAKLIAEVLAPARDLQRKILDAEPKEIGEETYVSRVEQLAGLLASSLAWAENRAERGQ